MINSKSLMPRGALQLVIAILIGSMFSSCNHVYRQTKLLPQDYYPIKERFRISQRANTQEILDDIEENNRQQPIINADNEYSVFSPPKTITSPLLYPLSRRSDLTRKYIELGYAYALEKKYDAASIAFCSSLISVRNTFASKYEREYLISNAYRGLREVEVLRGHTHYANLLNMIISMENLVLNHPSCSENIIQFNKVCDLVYEKQLKIEKTQDDANFLRIFGIVQAGLAVATVASDISKTSSLGDNSEETSRLISEKFGNNLGAALSTIKTSIAYDSIANVALVKDADEHQVFANSVINEFSKIDPYQTIITKDARRLLAYAQGINDTKLLMQLAAIMDNTIQNFPIKISDSGIERNLTTDKLIERSKDLLLTVKSIEVHLYKTERKGLTTGFEGFIKGE